MNSEESQLLQVYEHKSAPFSIAYRFRKPERDATTFVWFSGFRSEMSGMKAEALASFAAETGAGCLRFDYSGHGRSGGRFEDGSISAWLADAKAVYGAALPDAAPSVFVGSSMGGWIALLLARRLAEEGMMLPKAMVLIAPAWNLSRLFWEMLPQEARATIEDKGVFYRPSADGGAPYPITKTLIEDGKTHLFDEEAPLALDFPIRILHGCLDAEIPFQHSLHLLSMIKSMDIRLSLIKDGDHRLSRPQDLALLRTTLIEFL